MCFRTNISPNSSNKINQSIPWVYTLHITLIHAQSFPHVTGGKSFYLKYQLHGCNPFNTVRIQQTRWQNTVFTTLSALNIFGDICNWTLKWNVANVFKCKKKKVIVVILLPFNRKKSVAAVLCFLSLSVCKVLSISFHHCQKLKVTDWSTKFGFSMIEK